MSSFQELKPNDTEQEYKTIDIVSTISESLEKRIIGYADIKYLIVKVLKASIEKPHLKAIYPLFVGAKSTGKTAIFKAIEESLPEGYVIYYDASMATRVGLLDHLHKYKEMGFLDKVRIILFDEIDKMPKSHQFGILNLLESGIMMETKFKRHREVDVRGKVVFGAGNELKKIYPPLASRFFVVEMNPYTEEEFFKIGMGILFKMGFQYYNAFQIIKAINENISDKVIRDVVRLGTLVDNNTDLQTIIRLSKKRIELV